MMTRIVILLTINVQTDTEIFLLQRDRNTPSQEKIGHLKQRLLSHSPGAGNKYCRMNLRISGYVSV